MQKAEEGQMELPQKEVGVRSFRELGHVDKGGSRSEEPDPYTQAALDELDQEARKQTLEHVQDEHTQRIDFAKKIYWLSCIWLALVVAVVIASGISCLPFKLDNSVLITLLTTTTATVLGLFISVLNYLFSRRK